MNRLITSMGASPHRHRVVHGLVLAVLLASLTWLYYRAESVAPNQHFIYTQRLRDLRELDAAIDIELLSNRQELARNFDALTHYTQRAVATSTDSLSTPDFLSPQDHTQLVVLATDLHATLVHKAVLIDTFKRNSSVVRNSWAYFPVAASAILDSNAPVPIRARRVVDRYARTVLAFARAPSATGRAQIAAARAPVAALKLASQQRHRVENLLRHGDIITLRLTELDQLMQAIFDLHSNNRMEALSRAYSLAHERALTDVDRYRVALYATSILLLAYLTLTFLGLARARNSLQIAHREVSERYVAQLAAEKQLRLHATAFNNAHEGITLTDAQGTIVDVNPAFTRITGYAREEVMGLNPRVLQSGRHDDAFYDAMWHCIQLTGSWRGEIWNRNKQGDVYPELLSISAVHDDTGRVTNYVAVFADIGRIKEQEKKLTQMAYYDALTELPNRALLTDRLTQAMAQTLRAKKTMAICYLDLDGFKQVNDTWGHEAGDRVLIEIATRMKETVRGGDTVARLGGDEFVLLLLELADTEECDGALRRLLHCIAQPLIQLPERLALSASIGVTLFPTDDADPDALMRHADQAMYQAKLAGKNRFHLFDSVQDSSIRVRYESLERIRVALERAEFVLHYQPKVNMRTGQVVGAEALIRWQHPERGMLPPSAFLPVVEDHLLAVDIGEWVIDTALKQVEIWHASGLRVPVSVNIGARQMQQSNFFQRLQDILSRHQPVCTPFLELEILETSALADLAQVSQVIQDCTQIGVKFALDDFGTGYSSLAHLKRLRVATLKIDQSFVRDMCDDPDDVAILKGIIDLAAAFRHAVVAEGVETVTHGAVLLQLGCEVAQGFGIAPPMPAEHMPDWVATWRPDDAWLAHQSAQEASSF